MSKKGRCFGVLSLVLVAGLAAASRGAEPQKDVLPRVVAPGEGHGAPADAVVLFDGTDLSGWTKRDGSPAGWKIADGVMTAVRGQGPVISLSLIHI